ncbi:alpha/beta hydrolase [Fulvivirga sp.]|uniref:alpha/beta fold hydrolase n=1 Tax=Fulvivirga sp. TaxID=1931237 RepID=UPI0032F02EA2
MKPVAILLHGAMGSEKQLFPLKQLLSENFDVYALNFTGHGGKAFGEEFGIERFSKDLVQLLDQKNLNNVNIFGYSMGGYVAINAALSDSRIAKIFTLGTKFGWSLESATQAVKMFDPGKIEEKVPAFAVTLKLMHQPQDWKEVMTHTTQMMISLGKSPILHSKNLKEVKIPVIIGLGAEDKMVSVHESKEVVNALHQSEFQLYEGFKHPIEQVDISVLANDLTEFFLKES